MQFYLFLEKILSDIWLNIFVYILFLTGYFFLFKHRIWTIVDPLFIHVVSMASAAYCVYILTYYNLIDIKYTYSFISTELAFLLGFFLIKNSKGVGVIFDNININYKELQLFMWSAAVVYIVSQLITFRQIGMVLFKEDTNHVFAFEGHSTLRVFLNYSRTIFLISLFYKRHLNGMFTTTEWIVLILTVVATLLGGSKSALLTFFSLYIIVNYIYNIRLHRAIYKIKKHVIVLLISSAVIIIFLQGSSSITSSLISLYYRFVGSGDVFVLGYNDNAVNSIHEKSGLKYIFYPGLGTILKYIFGISPPHIIGVDLTEFHTGKTDSGPNARHNFIGMVFWGYGGILFSFLCGLSISWVRNRLIFFRGINYQFIFFIIVSLLTYSVTDLISDANLFMNNLIWSLFMLLLIYILSSFISLMFLIPDTPKNNQC